MARKTFTHKTEDGRVETRTSATKDYTHVVVGWGTPYKGETGWHVARWSESEANATKAAMSTGRDLAMFTYKRAEAINGGEREVAEEAGEERRTMGELTTEELIQSAWRESGALAGLLERDVLPLLEGRPGGGNTVLLLNAYVGSIRARLAVAECKLAEAEEA